jgi:hypothetical protein
MSWSARSACANRVYRLRNQRDARTSFCNFRRCGTLDCSRTASLMPVVLAQHGSWSDFAQIVANWSILEDGETASFRSLVRIRISQIAMQKFKDLQRSNIPGAGSGRHRGADAS